MAVMKLIEYCLGYALYRSRDHDVHLFIKSAAFFQHPRPTIRMASPDCGDSGAILPEQFTKFGSGDFPSLRWLKPAETSIAEYVMIIEDPDSPLGKPNVHGIYCGIPSSVDSLVQDDLAVMGESNGIWHVKAGYRVGSNHRNAIYILPRPPRGHGPHCSMFQLVALNDRLHIDYLSQVPTKLELTQALNRKVAAWGIWEAIFEAPN